MILEDLNLVALLPGLLGQPQITWPGKPVRAKRWTWALAPGRNTRLQLQHTFIGMSASGVTASPTGDR